jgi:hypothetical protein
MLQSYQFLMTSRLIRVNTMANRQMRVVRELEILLSIYNKLETVGFISYYKHTMI